VRMQVNPLLAFNGQCEAAFRFYEKCLGGKIVTMMTYGDTPAAEQAPPDWRKKIIHATLSLGDQVLMGADATPERYQKPQGFSVMLGLGDAPEAERIFRLWPRMAPCKCRSRKPSGRCASGCWLTNSERRG
jgi:PhnB protein